MSNLFSFIAVLLLQYVLTHDWDENLFSCNDREQVTHTHACLRRKTIWFCTCSRL